MSSLESLASRLVSDADFCVALDTDPEAALAACGHGPGLDHGRVQSLVPQELLDGGHPEASVQ